MQSNFSAEYPEAHRVILDVFSGPLDLLLTLIKRSEIDIYDIPVAVIAEQYLAMLAKLDNIDLENAGEFLILATQLLEIKSLMVLPRSQEEEDDDPRLELVQKLLEYKKYRDLGIVLSEYQEQEASRFKRPAGLLIDESPQELDLENLDVWDLYQKFSELIEQVSLDWQTIVYDAVPIEKLMDKLVKILEQEKQKNVEFGNCIKNVDNKITKIGFFLALLELMRIQKIIAFQNAEKKIYLSLNPNYIETQPEPSI